jgi:hypothetical protein
MMVLFYLLCIGPVKMSIFPMMRLQSFAAWLQSREHALLLDKLLDAQVLQVVAVDM